MASYTISLGEIIEMWTKGQAYSTKDKIEVGRTKLFDFDYPIFDPSYKKVFETHFIRKFFMREIGFETEGLFKFQLETWILINMPYFNKMFESELIKFDPLLNVKMDETQKRIIDKDQTQDSTTDGTSTNTSTVDANGTLTQDNFDRQLESNNPDTRLAITSNDGEGVIEYASQIKESNENNVNTSVSNTTGETTDATVVTGNVVTSVNETEDYVLSKVGKVGNQSYSKMLEEYRSSLIRVENKIFDEMQELFMLVY